MISLILKCYLSTFIVVGIAAMICFLAGIYYFFKPRHKKIIEQTVVSSTTLQSVTASGCPFMHHANDIEAIAGDDPVATQLDLARAYIETGRSQLAGKILSYVIEHGSTAQQDEARQLKGAN